MTKTTTRVAGRICRSVRALTRNAVLHVLASAGRARHCLKQLRYKPRVEILLFHRIRDEDVVSFRRLLEFLDGCYHFISYSDAVSRIQTGDIDDAYLTFSFDDGLDSCLTAGQILHEYGASGCFFVCPGIIGERNTAVIDDFCRDWLRIAPSRFMDWDQLEQLVASGHEVGGHTMNHPNLAQLSSAEAADEIGQSRAILMKRLGAANHFAWPYGRFSHASRGVVSMVFETGYRSCASGERGCHGPSAPINAHDVCLRRDSIEASWPLSHIAYFLKTSARRPLLSNQSWPPEWVG